MKTPAGNWPGRRREGESDERASQPPAEDSGDLAHLRQDNRPSKVGDGPADSRAGPLPDSYAASAPRTAASAASACAPSGPPACAMSGRPPPPLPPTAADAARTSSTALNRPVRSCDTPTTMLALPSEVDTSATTPLPICLLMASASP